MPKATEENRDQRHDENRAKARGFIQKFTDLLSRSTSKALSEFSPDDQHMRLGSQSLALAHISEGVRLLLGIGMDDGEIQQLVGKAAYRARAQQQAARQEIEQQAADEADEDFVDTLAQSHTDYQTAPQPGVDPEAPEVAPAPQPIDQSQPAAVAAQPSAATGQQQSPANSPQDKLAQASIASGGKDTTVRDAQIAGAQAQGQPTGPDAGTGEGQPTGATGAGAQEGLGVADTIDGDVIKGQGTNGSPNPDTPSATQAPTDDAKAAAAAEARANAAKAAS